MRSCRWLPAVALSVVACLAHPFEPAHARPFDSIPAVYADWWQNMEVCAGVTAPLDRVEWYEVPGASFDTPDGARWGWWDPPHEIFVAEAYLLDQELVEHEMLHDLLGTGAHPPVFDACGVREPTLVTAGAVLPRADVQRNDRRAPVQAQDR